MCVRPSASWPQATRECRVSPAALYPKFNLLGAINLASNSLGTLFNSTSLNEAGHRHDQLAAVQGRPGPMPISRAKQEESQQAYFAYQKAVLGAVQNSEDALVRDAAEQRRFTTLRQAAHAGPILGPDRNQQYQAGLTNYVNVLTAQSNELQASDQLAQSSAALATDLASLYKALGGGWHADDDPGTTPPDHYGPLDLLK